MADAQENQIQQVDGYEIEKRIATCYRRIWRFIGLVAAYIAGIILTLWLIFSVQDLSGTLEPSFPIFSINTVTGIMFMGFGFALLMEFKLIRDEWKEIKTYVDRGFHGFIIFFIISWIICGILYYTFIIILDTIIEPQDPSSALLRNCLASIIPMIAFFILLMLYIFKQDGKKNNPEVNKKEEGERQG